MPKVRRVLAASCIAIMVTVATAPIASAGPPGPGSKPQCAGGKFPGANGNPHCPQN